MVYINRLAALAHEKDDEIVDVNQKEPTGDGGLLVREVVPKKTEKNNMRGVSESRDL